MAQTYSYSKIKPVYYPVGKFTNDQRPRFLKAPFDVVVINGVSFIQPLSIGSGPGAVASQSGNGDAEQARLVRQLFYTDCGDPVYLEEHEMGDGTSSWKGLHKFGLV